MESETNEDQISRPESKEDHPFNMPVVELEGDRIPLYEQETLPHTEIEYHNIEISGDNPWVSHAYDTSPMAYFHSYNQSIDPVVLSSKIIDGGIEAGFCNDRDGYVNKGEDVANPMVVYYQGKADAIRDLASLGLLNVPEGRNWSEYPDSYSMHHGIYDEALNKMYQIIENVEEYESPRDIPDEVKEYCSKSAAEAVEYDMPWPIWSDEENE